MFKGINRHWNQVADIKNILNEIPIQQKHENGLKLLLREVIDNYHKIELIIKLISTIFERAGANFLRNNFSHPIFIFSRVFCPPVGKRLLRALPTG